MMDEKAEVRLGEILKQGRLRQRLSIVECAKRTHISARFLQALEDERWSELPSESHRLGFLRAYSQFLGVPADEATGLYQKSKMESGGVDATAAPANPYTRKADTSRKPPSGSWFTGSWEQLFGVLILLLVGAWGIYHLIGHKEGADLRPNLWTRPRSQQSRLVATPNTVSIHHLRVQAQGDTWLRVSENGRLVFEGILQTGSSKNWSGLGPYHLRIGDVKAISVYWNDQPVQVTASRHGGISDLRLPQPKQEH